MTRTIGLRASHQVVVVRFRQTYEAHKNHSLIRNVMARLTAEQTILHISTEPVDSSNQKSVRTYVITLQGVAQIVIDAFAAEPCVEVAYSPPTRRVL